MVILQYDFAEAGSELPVIVKKDKGKGSGGRRTAASGGRRRAAAAGGGGAI